MPAEASAQNPVRGAAYADYGTPPLECLHDIAVRGADVYADAPAFEYADGSVTTYAQLASCVESERIRLRSEVRTRVVPLRESGPERAAALLLAAWAEGRAVLMGPATCSAVAASPVLAEDPLLDGAACVLASSGTTGVPKLVTLTRAGVLADLLAGLARYKFTPGARCISLLPVTHAFGLVCDMLAPLATGGCICVPSAPSAFLAQLAAFGPTALNVPPQVADLLLRAMQARVALGESPVEAHGAVTGGHLRKLMCGGAGLGAHIVGELRAFGVEAYGCYGLSECSPCVSINRERHAKDGSAGLPLDVNEVRIAPDGEILVCGANVMAGYLGRPDLTAQAVRDDWLHTGDVGRLDADGFLWVRGRKDSLIALADGTLVSPEAWERALCEVPGVRQVLVRGEGVGTGGVALVARVCADECAVATPAARKELVRACKAASPDGVHLLTRVDVQVEPLPVTALGKTRR